MASVCSCAVAAEWFDTALGDERPPSTTGADVWSAPWPACGEDAKNTRQNGEVSWERTVIRTTRGGRHVLRLVDWGSMGWIRWMNAWNGRQRHRQYRDETVLNHAGRRTTWGASRPLESFPFLLPSILSADAGALQRDGWRRSIRQKLETFGQGICGGQGRRLLSPPQPRASLVELSHAAARHSSKRDDLHRTLGSKLSVCGIACHIPAHPGTSSHLLAQPRTFCTSARPNHARRQTAPCSKPLLPVVAKLLLGFAQPGDRFGLVTAALAVLVTPFARPPIGVADL
jgi:hypothetical protein